MFDDYGLRLLAEIGVDAYVPRGSAVRESAAASPAQASGGQRAGPAAAVAEAAPPAVPATRVVVVFGSAPSPRLSADLLRTLRAARLDAAIAEAGDLAALDAARAWIVFGESVARGLGAQLPAQRLRAVEWVVAAEPADVARSAAAKRALWGEIKRLTRVLGAGAVRS
ncbi:hypothetical protein ACQQ2N_10190 [Dokdonella sp. MW10]|uniref:hypothetical protein n=1 Tax=Dokdonella sp. MW10 TaxID=2992926 RepID=UPI003F819AC1